MTPHPVDLSAVATALGDALPPMTTAEQALAREIYRALLAGNAPSIAELTDRLDTDPERLSETLYSWPGVYFDDTQRIAGFWGLALPETPHHITIGDTTIHAWCAFDPLFILPLACTTGAVASRCPVTGTPIELTVTPQGIRDLTPAETVVSMLTPSSPFDADIRATFCHYVLFFASPEAGQTWTAAHPDTVLLPVADAFDLAQRVNNAAFPALSNEKALP